jgi:hypothetical protein
MAHHRSGEEIRDFIDRLAFYPACVSLRRPIERTAWGTGSTSFGIGEIEDRRVAGVGTEFKPPTARPQIPSASIKV